VSDLTPQATVTTTVAIAVAIAVTLAVSACGQSGSQSRMVEKNRTVETRTPSSGTPSAQSLLPMRRRRFRKPG
jgi:hypothetical protein